MTSVKAPPSGKHVWKTAAHAHFERWAHHYDRGILNTLLFDPCHRRVLTQVRQWRRRGLVKPRILDIGCGTGTLATLLMGSGQAVGSVDGLDMSDSMIDKAKSKADHLGLNGNVKFVVGDAEHLPFDDGAFDIVTCCNSFHHYPHQDRALGQMHRVLDSNGRLILIDGHRDDPLGHFIFDVCVTRAENHVHHCSAQRFRDLMVEVGFSSIDQHVFGVCPPAIINTAEANK